MGRESEFPELWHSRNERILDRLLELKSSIICLQEFWIGNEELKRMYERRLSEVGYVIYMLPRTNNRGDGLLTAVLQDYFHVLNYREVQFNDIGDRVAQLLHLGIHFGSQLHSKEMKKEILVVNTHLIFPHDSTYCFLRLEQAYKIVRYIESYCRERQLQPLPIILCGDWNGSRKGNVYKFLQSQGFVSSYDSAHCHSDNLEDFSKWVSHCNHRGNVCGVDFIWLLNPDKPRKPLKQSFVEAALENISKCCNIQATQIAQFPLLENDNGESYIYSHFSEALTELGLGENLRECLHNADGKDIWELMDVLKGGMIDPSQITKIERDENHVEEKEVVSIPTFEGEMGFKISKAMFFPQEVERGVWPEYYSLSDHAQLTVEFSPVQLQAA